MRIRKTVIVLLGIIALSFLTSACFYSRMPEQMATHFNAKGEVDGYTPRLGGVLFMPILISVTAILLMVIPKIDPLRSNIEKFRKYYDGFIICFSVFMLSCHFYVILWNLGVQISINAFMSIGIGLLFFYAGILCENSKRNWFVGIRTPWTLSSELVWLKTHKLGGKLFKIVGLIIFAGIFFPNYLIYFILVPVFSITIITVVYSYLEYKKCERSSVSAIPDEKQPEKPMLQNKKWQDVKNQYLNQVEKALSATKNPRTKEVLADVSSHLDRRFAELGPDEQTWENFQAIITDMGPPSDYAELLDTNLPHSPKHTNLKSVLAIILAAIAIIAGMILLPILLLREPKSVTEEEFSRDFAQKVTQFDIDNADLNKVIDTFGHPLDYIWGQQTLDRKNLPSRYVVVYPYGFQVFISQSKVVEIRFEHEQPKDYLFLGKLRVGSSLDEVIEVIGRPFETVEGLEIGWVGNVLYKDINGRKGHCYYHRPDKNVRIFFGDYKVAGLYITRSDYDGD